MFNRQSLKSKKTLLIDTEFTLTSPKPFFSFSLYFFEFKFEFYARIGYICIEAKTTAKRQPHCFLVDE